MEQQLRRKENRQMNRVVGANSIEPNEQGRNSLVIQDWKKIVLTEAGTIVGAVEQRAGRLYPIERAVPDHWEGDLLR